MSGSHTAYLILEIGVVAPTGIAAAYWLWRFNIVAWRNIKQQHNSPQLRAVRAWKPTGAQIAPNRRVRAVTFAVAGVIWLAILGVLLTLLIAR